MKRKPTPESGGDRPSRGEVTLYRSADGAVQVQCLLQGETLWLTQKALAELFGVDVPAVSKHLANIFESGELRREATVSVLETVQQEGARSVKRKLEYYNLIVLETR